MVKQTLNKYINTIFVLGLLSTLSAQNTPFFAKDDTQIPTVLLNAKWKKVKSLSDEFNGEKLDCKWTKKPISNGFNWIGRKPGLFESDNVHILNGQLFLEAEKFNAPKTIRKTTYTYGGAIVRSVAAMEPGMYIEGKMRTNETHQSGTFWLVTNSSVQCTDYPKVELDITESVGRRTGYYRINNEVTNEEPTGKNKWMSSIAHAFEFGMNPTSRQRKTQCLKAINKGRRDIGNAIDPSQEFVVYGFWWENPTSLHFFMNGTYQSTIKPPIPHKDPMHITMALETYDQNAASGDDVADGYVNKDGTPTSLWDRSSKYEWVRTWKMK